MTPPPNVILIGTMGAGKTSTAKELSRILDYEFWDMDLWIEDRNQKKIPEIFERNGEKFFREQESQAVDWLTGGRDRVISTGGGVWVDQGNREKLLALGCCVWLRVSPKEAIHRIGSNANVRPLLSGAKDPLRAMEGLLAEREPLYSLAHEKVETDRKNPREVALEIQQILMKIKPFSLE